MLTIPFLTDLDSRAAVKGSRDPLGIQQIWTRLGRHVVGNLTTVSNSVRDFTVLMLGFYFAEQLAHELGPGSELATFLKWEQLAAYSRATTNKDWVFRGTERVRKNLDDGSYVTLSEERTHQILSDQKTYGIWGLYTMASRASGLVESDATRLKPDALQLVEQLYLPIMAGKTGRNAHRILELLRAKSTKIYVHDKDKLVVQAVGKVLSPHLLSQEREFFRFHLLNGGPQDATEGKQKQLVELLESTLNQKDFAWSPSAIANLVKTSHKKGETWYPLADRLHRIRTSESVLAPVSALFTHLLGLREKTVNSMLTRLKEEWGKGLHTVNLDEFHKLRGELRGDVDVDNFATGDRWVSIADALWSGDYKALINLLIEQNKSVMEKRGGAPWIENRDRKFHVRFIEEQGPLPKIDEIASMWRFPYFLDSLRSVAATLKEK